MMFKNKVVLVRQNQEGFQSVDPETSRGRDFLELKNLNDMDGNLAMQRYWELHPDNPEMRDIPKFILNCPVAYNWVEYKGETYFGVLNYERSITARKPMIDLSYCATKAMNNIVLKTVQYDKKYFKPSKL
jgi:hypothetical protein